MTPSWLVRHGRSALSRGAGYEATPIGSQFVADAVSGYYLDFSAKTAVPTAAAPESLLPAALAQLGLGWWELTLRGVDAAASQFARVCDRLEGTAKHVGTAALWPYRVRVAKYELPPEWISALAQGQAASVFVRAYVAGGEERHAELARAAIEPLLRGGADSVRARTVDGIVLEECPTRPPSAILNGWIYAAWGLRDVAIGLGSDEARSAYEETVQCLRSVLPQYDMGWWSRYSLYPHRLPDLAKLFYHRLHVEQLRVLDRLTADTFFASVAARWQTYDTPAHRLRLVGQKARFVASRYR